MMDQLRLLSPFYRNDKANTIFLQEADNTKKNRWIKLHWILHKT